jgi:hypothetical protein
MPGFLVILQTTFIGYNILYKQPLSGFVHSLQQPSQQSNLQLFVCV